MRQLLPVILYWTHESPRLEQLLTHSSPLLTLRLLEQFSCLWKCTRFCCIFILSHCHYILTVLTWAQASVTVTPLQARKEESSPQTRLATRFWLRCALGLLCSIDMCCVTRLAGGFLKQKKEKKAYPGFHSHCEKFPGCSPVRLQHVSTVAVSPISHWCSSSQIIGAHRTLRHRPVWGDTRSRFLASRIISTIFFMVFSAGPVSTTSVIKGP